MSERTIWIVDGAYLLKASTEHFDYLKLKAFLEEQNGSPFEDSFYLNSTPNPPTDAQDGFHTWLKSAPPRGPKMRVKLYKLKDIHCECPSCGNRFEKQAQKGVDVGTATLIVKLAAQNQYDRLLLSAGDGDFEDAISYAKEEMHKQFWLSGFDGSVSADLQSYAGNVIWLDQASDRIRKA